MVSMLTLVGLLLNCLWVFFLQFPASNVGKIFIPLKKRYIQYWFIGLTKLLSQNYFIKFCDIFIDLKHAWNRIICMYSPSNTRVNTCTANLFVTTIHSINPLTAKLFNLNFHPLEVVSRWRDSQLQVRENYSDLTKWRSTVFKCCWLMSHIIYNMFKMWYLMW